MPPALTLHNLCSAAIMIAAAVAWVLALAGACKVFKVLDRLGKDDCDEFHDPPWELSVFLTNGAMLVFAFAIVTARWLKNQGRKLLPKKAIST